MKQSHEVFLDFPTEEEYVINREKSTKKIDEILKEWGSNRIVFTMSLNDYKKIEKNINNSDNYYSKLKPLEENKEKNNEEKNSNNEYRQYRFNEDIKQELLLKLINYNKLTEFIDNNGQVKENTKKFDAYCNELLKEIFVNEDKNTKELILECNSEEDNYSTEEYDFINKDETESVLTEENSFKNMSEDNEKDKIKEENIMNITDSQINSQKNKKEPIFLYTIKQYYFNSIRNAQDDNILKMFLLSYFIVEDKIRTNKYMSPADMANEFKAEDVQKKLKGKIKSDEKEKVLKEFLDPLRFWNDFEIEFSEETKIFDYYKILYDLIPQPKIVTKEKDGKKYLSEELTKTHYRKKDDLRNQIYEFIDNCMEDLKKNKEVQEQINNFIKEHELQTSYDKLLEDCIKEMKIKQEIGFLKTTRSNDIKIKEKTLDKLSDTETCSIDKYELINSYVSGKITKEDKEEIDMHLRNCKKCRDFFIIAKKGFEYRKKRNEQISFMLRKPYAKPIQSLTEEEYLKQSYSDYYKTNFKNNSCYTNWCYLILSLINSGKVEEAKKIFEDGISVYKGGSFIYKTQIDLDKINK